MFRFARKFLRADTMPGRAARVTCTRVIRRAARSGMISSITMPNHSRGAIGQGYPHVSGWALPSCMVEPASLILGDLVIGTGVRT